MKILIISKDNIWTEKLVQMAPINSIHSSSCTKELIDDISPDWIFFFHWSEIVSKDIYENYRCAVIHTGNLPEGRGGSPIQNQILDGICNTNVNIIEMSEPIDSGAVYCSHPITLQGTITDIWMSIAVTAHKLIMKCVSEDLTPKCQQGISYTYNRIKTNKINFNSPHRDLSYIYDQIRMVDSEDYPNPYVEIGDYRIEFSRAKMNNNNIITDAKITKK
tara:strand:- start:2408 stop:3064 length:657 start_codon:yes stop_codon:yes gene_type:complete